MRSRKKKWVIVLAILVVLGAAAAGGYAYYVRALAPVSLEPHETDFTVESGEPAPSILARLESAGLIRSSFAAKVYVRLSGQADFKAGNFILDPSWNTKRIIAYLNDSAAAQAEQVSVTIVEGSWAKDIAKALAENTNVTADELLAKWNDKDYITELANDYWFITPDIFNSQHVYLEGYLYPSTYNFFKDTDADAITRRFLDQTEKVLDQYKDEIESSKLTVHQVMTMASIIQFEGKTEDDMRLIASVFYNRLDRGMRLQSSVTVCYALYDYQSWSDCETNTGIESDYNTYQVEGLPPGPILNPGEAAIKAALEPASSDYLYFMADVYGDGTIYFARTYQEHEANVQKYLR